MAHPTRKHLLRLARKHREIAEHLEAAAAITGDIEESPPKPELSPNGKQTSLSKIREYLQLKGPVRRFKISEETGIPLGTIAGILTPDNGFERVENGWIVSNNKDAK